MSFYIYEDADARIPTVKNTFIDLRLSPKSTERRPQSAPPSPMRRHQIDSDDTGGLKFTVSHVAAQMDSDASTDAQTERSNDVEECALSDFRSNVCPSEDERWFESPQTSPGRHRSMTEDERVHEASLLCRGMPQRCCQAQSSFMTSTHLVPPPPSYSACESRGLQRLNLRAAASQANMTAQQVQCHMQSQQRHATNKPTDRHVKNFEEIISAAVQALKLSPQAVNVEVCGGMSGWSVVARIEAVGEDAQRQTEHLLTLAKETLLHVTSQSKAIYLMGYTQKAFKDQAQGFSAMLCEMESAKTACWHVYKKGFCRHGDGCNKQHPNCLVPVQVLVETGKFNTSLSLATEFKEKVVDVAVSVTSKLKRSPYARQVEAIKDKDEQGWTIEVTMREDCLDGKDCVVSDKDCLLSLAKRAIFEATKSCKDVYILGHSAKPFIAKPNGFVTLVANLEDESKACWGLYNQGFCNRGTACRFEHPACVVPVNVVIKQTNRQPMLSVPQRKPMPTRFAEGYGNCDQSSVFVRPR